MHEVLVNRLGGLSLPRKSVVRLTDRPDMTLDVYRGRKTTIQLNTTLLVLMSFNIVLFYDRLFVFLAHSVCFYVCCLLIYSPNTVGLLI